MSTALADSQVEHLLGFVGYGNPSGPVWFLGMEEGGGGEQNLRNRLAFSMFEDLYEGHKKLGIVKHHEGRRVIQRTWRGMCLIMLRLNGEETTPDTIRMYQAEALGRQNVETFLAELMPIPKPSIGDWGYEEFMPQFRSRDDYYSRIMPKRITHIRGIVEKYSPSIVIAYGKSYWPSYRHLFRNAVFVTSSIFEVTRAEPLVVLCPHFTSRAMNGRFDEVVELVRPAYETVSA